MKNKNILNAGIVIAIALAFVISATAVMNRTYITMSPVYESSISIEKISIEKAVKMIESEEAIFLNVQSEDSYSTIDGAIPVKLADLACSSCLENLLQTYDNIIVYSKDHKLISEASNMLKERSYTVYELVEPLSPLASETPGIPEGSGIAKVTEPNGCNKHGKNCTTVGSTWCCCSTGGFPPCVQYACKNCSDGQPRWYAWYKCAGLCNGGTGQDGTCHAAGAQPYDYIIHT